MRYKYLHKLKYAIKQEEKLRKKYIASKLYSEEMAKRLSEEYYAAESDHNLALEFLHAFGLSHEALEADCDDPFDDEEEEITKFEFPEAEE